MPWSISTGSRREAAPGGGKAWARRRALPTGRRDATIREIPLAVKHGALMLGDPPHVAPLTPPYRVLLAPGPTNLPPAVSEVLTTPLTGHKDPYYLQVMDETAQLLRYVYVTENKTSMSLPGTGGAGMEAAMANLIQSGDTVVVGNNGLFASR